VPVQQKVGAGLGAADLYEQKLDQHDKALDVLVALDRAGLSDVAIHERVARAAARAQAWIPATTYLQKLVQERTSADGRIEAARLVAAIFRDRLDDPNAAVPALVSILREAPGDLDAVEQILDVTPTPTSARDGLARSLPVLRAAMQRHPDDARSARAIARMAAVLGDHDVRQIALGVLGSVAELTGDEQRALEKLEARLGSAPAVALDSTAQRHLADPEDGGAIVELFRLMGPTIAEALGPTVDTLGVGRREKIDPRSGSTLRNEISAWAGALGLGEFDLYVGGRDPNVVQGVPGETPALVVGASIRTPLSLEHRARVVREIVGLVRGTTIVNVRDDIAVAAVVVASCALVEIRLQSPAYAVLAETQRSMGKAIARKTRKVLPDVANAVARELGGGGDLRTIRPRALRTLDRAAAIAAGDPRACLVQIVGGRANSANVSADPRARAMLQFMWSDDFLALRRQLGLGVG
jgi:hypothetical protein